MVSLALICSFTRMRNHLSLGDVKQDDVSEDTVKAVAETLRKSTVLKLSEDGEFYFFSLELYILTCVNWLGEKCMKETNSSVICMNQYIRLVFVRLVIVCNLR